MITPDYNNSIVNLVSSIVIAEGGEMRGYAPLAGAMEITFTNGPIVLLIIDGLGDNFLHSFPSSFLHRHRRGRLTTVFPSTTATAITSYYTGVAPQQHAITGWHTYLKELGTVATVLPFKPRYGGNVFSEAGISPTQIVTQDSLFNNLETSCHVIAPHHLNNSAYSRTLSGRAQRHGYDSHEDLFNRIVQLCHSGGRLIVAYSPELDSLAHTHGTTGVETIDHFLQLDDYCRQHLAPLAAAGATIIISADHGLIDTDEAAIIQLEDHPTLAATMTLPLCGEPRCAFCYVRAGHREQFEAYVTGEFAHACTLIKSAQLIEQGYFGSGPPSPRLAERAGDYALLMKESYCIKDTMLTDKKFLQKGVHGGLSANEMYVPLIVLQ